MHPTQLHGKWPIEYPEYDEYFLQLNEYIENRLQQKKGCGMSIASHTIMRETLKKLGYDFRRLQHPTITVNASPYAASRQS